MKRNLRSLAFFVLLTLIGTMARAQTTMYQFNFEGTVAPSVDNVVGVPSVEYFGAANFAYSTTGSCLGTRSVSSDGWIDGAYVMVVANASGFANMNFSYCNRVSNAGSFNNFKVRASADGGVTWTDILAAYTPTTSVVSKTAALGAAFNNAETLLIQIFKVGDDSSFSGRTWYLDNIQLTGTAIAAPTISSFSSASACVGTGFNIVGTNFTGATAVTINGTAAASFTVNSATSITAIPATGNSGGLVRVTTANGTGTSASSIAVNPVPTGLASSATPATVCAGSSSQLASSATATSNAVTGVNRTVLDIPDNSATGVTSTIAIPTTCALATAVSSVYVNINHTYNADVTAILQAPNGTQINLVSGRGGSGSNIIATFQTGATALPAAGTNTAITGTYAPQAAFSGLSGTATGNWSLIVKDGAAQDTGMLLSWSITIGAGTCAVTYSWSPSTGLSSTSIANPVANPAATTAYTVTATSSSGCTTTSNVTVTVNPTSVGGSVGGATSVCATSNSGTLTLTGNTGNVIRWESSTNNFATAGTTIANTTTSLSYSGLTATTYYRAVVQSGSCATANSSVAAVTVNPASVGGSVSGSATVCAASNSGTLTLTGNTGNVIRWESSTDNFSTAGTTIANTTTSLSYSGLTATTYYRAVVQSGSCATANSSVAAITVNPASVGGSVSGSATVCAASNSGTLTLSGNTGNVIHWESSTNNFATAGTTIANTTTSLSYSGLTATTYYRAVVQSGSCATANSSVATITVNPASVGGSISGSATVCATSNSGTLTLSGNNGNVIHWESSTNNFATAGTTIANTTTSLSYSGLTSTTYYRAVVQSGSCATANSSVATVTVNPPSIGGSVSGTATVCATLNSGTLTLSGNTGNVIHWESSTNNFATAGTTIANTTTSLSYSGLTSTTYYRAVVQSGSCATANSSVATVTVNPPSIGGSVSGTATVCATLNSGTLTLTGNTGNVIRWESSTNNFATAGTTIANTTTSLSYSGLASTTYYRAVVQSGSCATANSSVAAVTVNPPSVGGSVSGTATVCATLNSGTLTLIGNTGNVVRWESSTDNFATAGTTIANTTASLSYSGLTATTYYRAIVQNTSCATANSSVAAITVNPTSVGGSVSGTATVCATLNNGTLTLTGNTGNVVRWESSTDNFATAGTTIANTTTSLVYSGLTVTTYYRAVVQSGSCTSATSSVAAITVAQENAGGTLNGSTAFCSQTNSGTLTLSGYMGSQLSWQYSYDNFATAGIAITNTAATYNYANLSQTTYFRVIVGNGACASQASTVAVITVDHNSTWTGAADSNWHNSANWSCGEVPQSYTHVIIPAVLPQPIISADAFAYDITASSGTLVSLLGGRDLTVTDAINSAGGITVENTANVIQINNVANTGIAKVKRNSSALMRQDYTLWSSPVSGQNLLAFSTQTLTNRFYTYNTGTNLYNTVAAPATTAFDNGVGYLIRMPNNHPTTPTVWNGEFNGTLHNGNVSVPLANVAAGQRFNLVGNPYPSAIDMQAFVSDNASNITGALYFWRKTNNPVSPSYCSWTSGGGFVNNGELQAFDPQGVIHTGQGFFVEASASGTQVAFSNSQRSGNNANQFFRSANEIERNRIWLNATSAAGSYCQTLVGYIEGATMGDDAQIDGKFFNDGDISFYSLIGAERFVIQGRSLPFDNTDVVPMGFRATTSGTYSIAIDHLDGLFQNGQQVFLRDNLTGSVHDLGTGAYAFASDAGTFNTRFEVLYENSLSVHNPVFDDHSVIVYKSGGAFTINSGNMNMASVKVYDVLGKLVKEVKDINAAQTSFAVGGANQVLVFKIYSTENQEVVKKVVN